jgi:hypothetical protein
MRNSRSGPSSRDTAGQPPKTAPRPTRPPFEYTGDTRPRTTPKERAGWTDFETPTPSVTRSKTMRTPKKSGFDPNADGDEPAANASAYYNISRGATARQQPRPQSFVDPSNFSEPEIPVSPRADPLKGFRSPRSDDNINDRLSTPYATGGGEKTYFSSAGLNRTRPDSASNLSGGWNGESPGRDPRNSRSDRHRSASPRIKSPRARVSTDSSSDETTEDDSVSRRVKLRPKGRMGKRTNPPMSDNIKPGPPYPPQPSVTVENEQGKVFEFSKPGRSSTWTTEEANARTPANKLAAEENVARRTSTGDIYENRRSPRHIPREGAVPSPLHNSTPANADDFEPLEKTTSWQEKFGSPTDTGPRRHFEPPHQGTNQPKYEKLSFATLSKWRQVSKKFESNARNAASIHGERHRTSTSKDPREHVIHWNKDCLYAMLNEADKNYQSSSLFHDSSGSASPIKENGTATQGAPFQPQNWQTKFENAGANPFQPQNVGTEYTRRGSPIKGRGSNNLRSPRKMSVPKKPVFEPPVFGKPATVSNASESSDWETTTGVDANSSKSTDSADSSSAMDIDSRTPPVPEMTSAQHPHANMIRSQVPKPKPASPDPHAHLNMKDLKQTAPFVPNKGGLDNLVDLTTDLPFQSKAASTLPSAEIHPHRLSLPDPPRAPKPPSEPLRKSDWEYYLVFVRKYMGEWNMFNQKMLDHFNARQYSVENELPDRWIDGVGEGGLAKYMAWLEEDARVRTHWDVSYQKHVQAMLTFKKVKKAAGTAKFVD